MPDYKDAFALKLKSSHFPVEIAKVREFASSLLDESPEYRSTEAARAAIENDVHVIGVSSQAAGHKTLVPAIIAELKKQGADDIIVFVGGVIPRQDYEFLYEAGVKGIYGPGTPIPASAKDVLEQIRKAVA